jgi:Mn-dependent DtxR family transcriptional regulator
MARERYLQAIIDMVRSKGCITRRYIVDQLASTFNIARKQAERAAAEALESLVKRGLVVRKGRGVYCWSGCAPNP